MRLNDIWSRRWSWAGLDYCWLVLVLHPKQRVAGEVEIASMAKAIDVLVCFPRSIFDVIII